MAGSPTLSVGFPIHLHSGSGLHSTILLYHAVSCNAIPNHTIPYLTKPYNTMPCHTTMPWTPALEWEQSTSCTDWWRHKDHLVQVVQFKGVFCAGHVLHTTIPYHTGPYPKLGAGPTPHTTIWAPTTVHRIHGTWTLPSCHPAMGPTPAPAPCHRPQATKKLSTKTPGNQPKKPLTLATLSLTNLNSS